MVETVVEKVVTETVTTPEGDASAAVEAAQERIEEAHEIAEDIARAAMETQLGQQIAALAESTGKWQWQLETLTENSSRLEIQLTELRTIQTTQAAELEALKMPQAAVVLTPPASPGLPVEAQAALILPANQDAGAVVPEDQPTKPRKRWT